MQNKANKNSLQNNILKLVANRMKPSQSVNLIKSCCTTCIGQCQQIKHIPQQHIKDAIIDKNKQKYKICSKIYQVSIVKSCGNRNDKKYNLSIYPLTVNIQIKKQQVQNNQNITFTLEQAKQLVKEWVNYTLSVKQNNYISNVNKIILPLQGQDQMYKLRQKVNQIAALSMSHKDKRTSLKQESQNLESTVVQESIIFTNIFNYELADESTRLKPSFTNQNHKKIQSLKFLRSNSTIASQKLRAQPEQYNDKDLVRLLLVQAISLQAMI